MQSGVRAWYRGKVARPLSWRPAILAVLAEVAVGCGCSSKKHSLVGAAASLFGSEVGGG
jgi:hypothetical protein